MRCSRRRTRRRSTTGRQEVPVDPPLTILLVEVDEPSVRLPPNPRRRVVVEQQLTMKRDSTLQLERKDSDVMHRIMQENLSWRGARHPWLDWHPSAGSIFKKIEGVGAGRLVDQCGLKGYRVGAAQISHIHANILVNLGHATATEVITLIRHAHTAVREAHGYELQPEIGFIGEF